MKESIIKLWHLNLNYKSFCESKHKNNIVILHWWWGSSCSWTNIWRRLSEIWYNVYIPDLPWFWKTNLNKIYDVNSYAKLIENLVTKLKIQSNLRIIGHSNWWRIAITIETNNIIILKKLILIWSAWIRRKQSLINKILSISAKTLKPLKTVSWIKKLRELFYRIIWWQDYLKCGNDKIKQTFLNVLECDLQEKMIKIKTPTDLIWWSRDTYTPLKDGKLISSLIENSKITILKGERHWIHLKSPEKLFMALSKVLIRN